MKVDQRLTYLPLSPTGRLLGHSHHSRPLTESVSLIVRRSLSRTVLGVVLVVHPETVHLQIMLVTLTTACKMVSQQQAEPLPRTMICASEIVPPTRAEEK